MELSHPCETIIDNNYDIKKDLSIYKFTKDTPRLLKKRGDWANYGRLGLVEYYKPPLVVKKNSY
jgi:hypothetical protein